jgi:putative DNA primase/helicase
VADEQAEPNTAIKEALSAATVAQLRSAISLPGDGTAEHGLIPVTLADFLALELPPRGMLLAPILPEKSISMIFGPRGCGKTHIGLGIALAVAAGDRFLRWTASRPARVLYLDGEMPAKVLQGRLDDALKLVSDVASARSNLAILSADQIERSLPDLGSDDGREAYATLLDGVKLIIVDNLSTLCRTGKENEAEGWAAIQSWALEQRRAGRSVLFIHHSGKGGEQRGTSKREDVMDTVIKLSRPDDYQQTQGARFLVEFTKARGMFGDDAEPFEASLADNVWTMQESVNERDALILALNADGLAQRAIAKQVGIGVATVNRVLQKQRDKNGHAPQPGVSTLV